MLSKWDSVGGFWLEVPIKIEQWSFALAYIFVFRTSSHELFPLAQLHIHYRRKWEEAERRVENIVCLEYTVRARHWMYAWRTRSIPATALKAVKLRQSRSENSKRIFRDVSSQRPAKQRSDTKGAISEEHPTRRRTTVLAIMGKNGKGGLTNI